MPYDPIPGEPQHRVVAFHTRRGLRVCCDIDAQSLTIWTCPQAGKSTDFALRDLSNREDPVTVFRRLRFFGLDPAAFQRCVYDPFHCELHYGERVLHLAADGSHSAVVLWCEGGGVQLDIGSHRHDAIQRGADRFVASHVEPPYSLVFAAVSGPGTGTWWHSPVSVPQRSAHAQVGLAACQVLVLAAELAHEPVVAEAAALAALGAAGFLAQAGAEVAPIFAPGTFVPGPGLPAGARHQRLFALNRHLLWTGQDASGAMRDGPRDIYGLLWVRAGMAMPWAVWHGLPTLARDFTAFALANPTVVADGPVQGRMFGQLFGPQSKLEEDGLFYVVAAAHAWSAYSGDPTPFEGQGLRLLLEALDWLDRACWSEERGLYGRFFMCESPFAGSRDDGWDAAAGCKAPWTAPRWRGRTPVRSFDVYINLLQYAVLRLLAARVPASRRTAMLDRAERIARSLAPLFAAVADGGLPDYGWVEFAEGGVEQIGPYGLDDTDYCWALTVPPLAPPSLPLERARAALLADAPDRIHAYGFAFALTTALMGADPAWGHGPRIVAELERLRPHLERAGAYQPMPGAMPEFLGVPDGDFHHDIKPCLFAVGQWLPCYHALGLRRLAHGWAVRATDALASIHAMPLAPGVSADLSFLGAMAADGGARVAIDGRPVPGSLVLPEEHLTAGHHQVTVEADHVAGPLLLACDARLRAVERTGDALVYTLEGCGPCILRFQRDPGQVAGTRPGSEPTERVLDLDGVARVRVGG